MKWMGWVIALLCLLGFVAAKQQNAKRYREAKALLEQDLADVRKQADGQVATTQTGLEERRASLAKVREKTAELQAQKDELKAQQTQLTETIARLLAGTERLRDAETQTTDTHSENREEIQELQERLNQADRKITLWRKMIAMVSEPVEAQ